MFRLFLLLCCIYLKFTACKNSYFLIEFKYSLCPIDYHIKHINKQDASFYFCQCKNSQSFKYCDLVMVNDLTTYLATGRRHIL